MNERIKTLRKSLGLTQEEFSIKIGLSRNFIAQIESGTKTPSERTLKDICRIFNVNYIWLTTGIGEIEAETDNSTMAYIDSIMASDNKTAKTIFKAFAKLNKSEWELLEKIIKTVSEELW